ncbi:hypothetical protein BP6252_08723 [Coleophoma cylindrospora]|uniref:Postreplication repair E3 ubiquitin-protein ligase RAD18 n=1 Tax=Coleophoma cylindrospora TaxID=1849047 RepID=A0A3D8R6P1_9HELO|nr:hypothetical protein BP6252_08723 [Coleophoma cylindrospora]
MASKTNRDDLQEVEDSTDWLNTPLAPLAAVESALRCQVCTEFYTTPMITSCSHTFCSLCIRRCLSIDGKCPGCRAPDQELKLRSNWPLEEAVDAFKKARSGLLEHARKPVIIERSSPKRKLDCVQEDESDDGPRKRTRSSSKRTATASQQTVVIDSEQEDEDYIPNDGLVACPICNGRMTEMAIDRHIDQCNGIPPTTSDSRSKPRASATFSTSSKTFSKPERLPHLSYSMFKDNNLRKKLSELGISANGPRQLLEKRHLEWVSIWNANCDSKNPRTKFELKQDLVKWERTQGSAWVGSNPHKPGSQLLDKEFDGLAWSSAHDDSFKALIANARRKPPTGSIAPPESQSPRNAVSNDAIVEATPPRTTDHQMGGYSAPTTTVGSTSIEHLSGDLVAGLKNHDLPSRGPATADSIANMGDVAIRKSNMTSARPLQP